MHDQTQVLVPLKLLHSLPSKHQIGLACPLIDDNSLSLCEYVKAALAERRASLRTASMLTEVHYLESASDP